MDVQGGAVRWRITADSTEFKQGVEEAERDAQGLRKSLSEVDSSSANTSAVLSGLASAVSSVGWNSFKIGAGAASSALGALVSKGIQATDFLETARVSMSGLTGSLAEGNKAMSIAANYWQKKPFQRIDVTKATQQLVQFGRKTSQISEDLSLLGNVSLSTGVKIDELARYYARTAASGRAMTLDIEMMSDRGIPIYRELAKTLKTTEAGVREFASQGKIDFKTFKEAMENAINPEAMSQYEDTLARQKDRLGGAIQTLAGQLAGYKIINNELVISSEGLEKAYTRLLKTLATELKSDKMKDSMEKLGVVLAQIVDKVTAVLPALIDKLGSALEFITNHSEMLIPILGGALALFGNLASMIPGVGSIFGQFSNVITGVSQSFVRLIGKSPLLAVGIGALSVALVSVVKNSEDFRNALSNLLGAIGKLASSILPVVQVIVQAFMKILSSDAVIGVLTAVVNVIAWLANTLASFPTGVLSGIVSAILTLKLLSSASPLVSTITLVVGLIGVLSQLGDKVGGLGGLFSGLWNVLKNFASGIGSFIGSIVQGFGSIGEALTKPIQEGLKFIVELPAQLLGLGYNAMIGLLNGLIDGGREVMKFVSSLAQAIVTTITSALGIHSPSKVLAGVGLDAGLGLAQGIQNSKSAVEKGMDTLATAVLKSAETVISNMSSFGLIDIVGQYRAWKQVANLYTRGSSQYAQAIEKMEDARKSANLQIVKLQTEYNKTLDSTIDKISGMYGMFQSVSKENKTNSSKILKDLDEQVAVMQGWASAMDVIESSSLDKGLIAELQELGVESANELQAIANMTTGELEQLNSAWLKKQSIANDRAVKQLSGLRKDTLDEINEIKRGIDGETVDVQDVGGRLVSSIGEGIVGALPTLDSAFSQLNNYIADAAKSISKSTASSGKTASASGAGTDTSIADAVAKAWNPDSIKDEIQSKAEELGGTLAGVLGGSLGAVVLYKVWPKVWGKLKTALKIGADKSTVEIGKSVAENGKKILDKVGEKLPEGLASSAEQATSTISQTVTKVSEGASSIQTSMSRVEKLSKDVIAGAKAIVAVAVAVAAMAGALWVVSKAIPDDLLGLVAKLGVVALAVAAFGALAWIANIALKPKDVLAMVAIAGSIAVLGLALGVVDNSIKSDFGTLMGKLGAMGLAVVEIGALAVILGAVISTVVGGIILGAGMLALLALAGDIIVLAEAIGKIDKNVPDDFGKVKTKIEGIKEVCEMFSDLAVGGFWKNLGTAFSLAPVVAIAKEYVLVGLALNKIQMIDLDPTAVLTKVQLISEIMKQVASKDDESLSGKIYNLVSNFFELFKDIEIGAIVKVYAQMAEQLNYIQNVELNSSAILEKVGLIKRVVEKIGSTAKGSIFDQFKSTVNTFLEAQKDVSIASIVETYSKIADGLNNLEKVSITPETMERIQKASDRLVIAMNVITKPWEGRGLIVSAFESGILGNIASTVKSIGEMAEEYSKIGNAIKAIMSADLGDDKAFEELKSKLNRISEVIQLIVGVKGDGGLFGGIGAFLVGGTISLEKLDDVVNILRKLGDVSNTIEYIPDVDMSGAERKVTNLQSVIDKISGMRIPDDIGDREWRVGVATSIIKKFNEFAGAVNVLPAFAEDAVAKIENTRNGIWEATQVNENVGDLGKKEWIVGVATSIAYKLAEFAHAVEGLNDADPTKAIQTLVTATGTLLDGLRDEMLWKAEEFESVGIAVTSKIQEGIDSKQADIFSAGQRVQSSFWHGIQGKIQDEYFQGRAMGESFRQGLYDVDYANSGWWAVQGFINGANNRAYSGNGVYHVGYWIANEFLNGLKKRGDEGSPWKTTKQSGIFAVEGLVDGIREMRSEVVSEAETLADAVTESLTLDGVQIAGLEAGNISSVPRSSIYGREGYTPSTSRGVVIEQTNNNYTGFSIEQMNRDLAWQLSRV